MAIRVLHTSDSHWSERLRLSDIMEIHREMLALAREQCIDLWIHGGDWFDKRSTAAERTALAEWLQAAAEIAPVFGCKGNHDQAGDLDIFNRLETKHPVYIEERVTRFGEARVVDVGAGRRVGLVSMSWIDKANLAAGVDAAVSGQQTTSMTIEAIRALLNMLRAEAARLKAASVVPVMATHVMLGGSVMSSGQILIGQGVELSPSDLLELGCAYVACGHIHVQQAWFDGRVAYSGSPTRHTLGEDEKKGVRLVTLSDQGEFLSNEFRELNARPIILLGADWTLHGGLAGQELTALDMIGRSDMCSDLSGALVRYRYRVNASDLHLVDRDAIERALYAAGAREVTVEAIVESSTRARAPEIVQAVSLADKIDHYFRAKGLTVDQPTRARVLDKVEQLERNAHASA